MSYTLSFTKGFLVLSLTFQNPARLSPPCKKVLCRLTHEPSMSRNTMMGTATLLPRVRRKNPILDLQRFKPATYLYETLVKAT